MCVDELGQGGGENGGKRWALGHSFLKVGGEKGDMKGPEKE